MRDPNKSDWTEELEPKLSDISILGWCLVAIRAVLMLSIISVGIVFLFIARGVERPFVGPRRPISGLVVNWVCRIGTRAIGLRMSVRGTPMMHPGAVVATTARCGISAF